MQVIQTINDTIRILFSPQEEDFRLLDFLLVQESDNKYLAQIIEIYDDKYDASQNVARVKLFFKVNDKGEVFGYDHFTPSKECEIKKLRRDEILTFINEGKEALSIGIDYKTREPLDINLEFLKNHPVIFADKIDNSNNISVRFAHTLSRYNRHSLIFDYTGALEIENSKKIKLTQDLKLPLDFYTIEYIWEKGLATASLETQAICREIFNEVKTFAKNSPEGFIPFDKFLNVVEIQYKATPIVELTVLLNKLKAYQKNEIFAKTKKDFENITKFIEKNDITVVDFSELKTSWHKEFCEFIIRSLKKDLFVFLRLNETNADVDLINFMYDKKPDVYFVPSVSYSFSKMPHIIERAQNYILLPTLNPRRDFGAANFELSSISKDECILFGEDTENFIFTIRNDRFENDTHSEPKVVKTIKLRLDDKTAGTNVLKEKFRAASRSEADEEDVPAKEMLTEEELEFFEQLGNLPENEPTEEEKTPVKKPENADVCGHYANKEVQGGDSGANNNAPGADEAFDKETKEVSDNPLPDYETTPEEPVLQEENIQKTELQEQPDEKDNADVPDIESDGLNSAGKISDELSGQEPPEDNQDAYEPALEESSSEIPPDEELLLQEPAEEENSADEESIEPLEPASNIMPEGVFIEEEILIEEETAADEAADVPEEVILPADIDDTGEIIEGEVLDEEEISDESGSDDEQSVPVEEAEQKTFQNILESSEKDDPEDKEEIQSPADESLSLEALAQQSVEAAFNEVMEKEEAPKNPAEQLKDSASALVVDENVVIDLEKIKEHIDTKNGSELPIFKNKTEQKEKIVFKTGDKIEHDKYGKGEVVKVITYANRSLLQINFEEVGKRLLDPDIANIRKAQKS